MDYFEARGKLKEALTILNLKIEDKPTDSINFLHPGRCSKLFTEGNEIGYFGEIHPKLISEKKALKKNKKKLKIEIEVRSLQELKEVIKEGGVNRILFDNMMPSQIRQGIAMIDGQYETEASGGITEMSISEIADTGVDYISVGALTHSYKSLDMSLKAI